MRAALRLVVLALLAFSGSAAAHGYQVGGEPEPAALLDEAPSRVVVLMSEPIEPGLSHVRVLDADGVDHAAGPAYAAEGDDSRLAVDVALPGNGTYTVAWEARWRSDGHDTKGSFGFVVGGADPFAAPPVAATQDASAPAGGEVAARALLFLGAMLAVGALAFVFLVDGGRVAGLTTTAARAALAGVMLVLVATLWLLAGLLGPEGPAALAGTYAGRLLLARLLVAAAAAGVLLGAVHTRRASWLSPAAALVLAILPTISLVSHAASAEPRALAVAADVAHLLAAGAWVGGLPLLVAGLLRAPEAEAASLARRFSRVAMLSVALVVASGVYAGFLHLGADRARLVGSLYGRLLLAKVGLVGLLVALGAFNQLALLPRLRKAGALRRLRRVSVGETLVAAAVLVLAGALTAASPAPAPPALASGPASFTAEGADVSGTLLVTPLRVGLNAFQVNITTEDGPLVTARNVTLLLVHEDRSLGTASVLMTGEGNGVFSARASLGLPGTWVATVYVTRTDGYDDAMEFVLDVPTGPS